MSNLATEHPYDPKPHRPHPEWKIPRDLFPTAGPVADQLAFAVRYAVLAPSSHNTQPWLFHLVGDRLHLRADRTRHLPYTDPHDRELIISCGAALFTLRLALRHFGLEDLVAIRPFADDPNVLATVAVRGRHKPADDDILLFDQIELRRTSRGPFTAAAIPPGVAVRCARDGQLDGSTVYAVSDRPTRHQIARLIAEADRIQMHDHHFRAELASWMRPNSGEYSDGMPAYSMGHTSKIWEWFSILEPTIVRTLDLGRTAAAHDADLAEHAPLLIVIATSGDAPEHWLHAGQTLMRVLLRAQAAGLSVGYLNAPIQVPSHRRLLKHALNASHEPQILLRLGHGKPVEPTPRRPASTVTRRLSDPAVIQG